MPGHDDHDRERGLRAQRPEARDEFCRISLPVCAVGVDADAWIGGATAAGFVPADCAVTLRWLTGTTSSGKGSRPNDDIEKVK